MELLVETQPLAETEPAPQRLVSTAPTSSLTQATFPANRIIHCTGEMAECLFPDPRIFLERLGVPDNHITRFLPSLMKFDHAGLFWRMAQADLTGVSVEMMDPYFFAQKKPKVVNYDSLVDLSEKWLCQMEINPENSPFQNIEGLNLFKCTIVDIPAKLVSKVPKTFELLEPNILCLCLPREAHRQIEEIQPPKLVSPLGHAFCLLIYTFGRNGAIVTQIHNHRYEKMPEGPLKESYRDAVKILYLSLEQIVRRRLPEYRIKVGETGTGDKSGMISIVAPSFARKLFPDHATLNIDSGETETDNASRTEAPENNSNIGNPIYREDLPEQLGYHPIAVSREGELLKREESSRGNAMWTKLIPLRENYSGPTIIDKREKPWLTRYRELFSPFNLEWNYLEGAPTYCPTDRHIVIEGVDKTADISGCMEFVPAHPREPEAIDGMTRKLLDLSKKLCGDPLVAKIQAAIPPGFTLMSKGESSGIRADWWNVTTTNKPGWHVTPLHIGDQGRHPLLRFTHINDVGQVDRVNALGFKGGGLQHVDPTKIKVPSTSGNSRFPIYKLGQTQPEAVEILSHEFWGGITRQDAEVEYLHTLAMIDFLTEVDPDTCRSIPTPISAKTLISIPAWLDGQTVWYNVHDYESQILDEACSPPAKRLSSYVSLFQADARLSQVVNRILRRTDASQNNVDAMRAEIDSALNYLYWVNGERFNVPDCDIPMYSASLGWREIFEYLRLTNDINFKAATRIQLKFEDGLKTIAALHGAGGHFGGALLDKIGAVSGGATNMRNIDATGTFHDLDRDMFMPWVYRQDHAGGATPINRRHLHTLQWLDVLHWKDAITWSKNILFGLDLPSDATLRYYEVGRFNRFLRFDAPDAAMTSSPYTGSKLEPRLQIHRLLETSSLQEVYDEYAQRGRIIRD